MPIRYMGTKRHMTPMIKAALQTVCTPGGMIVDLFAGMGSVSASLANVSPITANDTLQFTNCIARAIFTNDGEHVPPTEMLYALHPIYARQYQKLLRKNHIRLREEAQSLSSSSWTRLRDYMASAPHAGSSDLNFLLARKARTAADGNHFQLAQLYFAAGYFSLHQSIQIDSIRYAINELYGTNDVALAMWLGALSDAANAPGHTAQFLKVHDARSAARVRQYWSKDIWTKFQSRMVRFEKIGSRFWRSSNLTTNLEARTALKELKGYDSVYADPPYTKDHYSRYYHLYETLYLYDYPAVTGIGRYRENRFLSDFSIKSRVFSAFDELLRLTAANEARLVLSYPSTGLLYRAEINLEDLVRHHFKRVSVVRFPTKHSTLGARQGHPTKEALECVYTCIP